MPQLSQLAVVMIVMLVLLLLLTPLGHYANSSGNDITQPARQILLRDHNLKAETIFSGLKNPTSMAFLGPNDLLVLEKNNGTVQRILNGKMLPIPLLHISVATLSERGMLGIAISKSNYSKHIYIFLYYTESGGGKTGDDAKGIQPLGNRVYRYELVNNKLTNPLPLLNLPANRGPNHNGGKILVGPDHNLYVIIGDVRSHRTQVQNVKNGLPPDGTSGILRITQDGKPVHSIPLLPKDPLNKYFAYGIRNSFGMDFDPVTGKLWDTENGPNFADEINLVEPGFNSGWIKIQGLTKDTLLFPSFNASEDLVNLSNNSTYRDPEFVWKSPVAPTAIKFLNSTKLGKQYQNDMFVGDINHGNLYHFKLNQQRTGLILTGSLADKVADNQQESEEAVFASGFQGITDLQVGPDGYLYILTFQGAIIRIVPSK